MARRQRRILSAPHFNPKTCEHCGDLFTPTSGRQRVCTKDECRRWKSRNYPSRKNGRYVKTGERPLRKKCEQPDCHEVFHVAPTGLIPQYCETHRRELDNATSIIKRQQWERRTLDAQCRYPDCLNKQHPKACGWCYKHYTIWSVHGLDADGWWRFFNDQDGLCPICRVELFDGRVVVVDHEHTHSNPRHSVDEVRGLVHAAPCNGMILGGIETAIKNGWFVNALDYIGVSSFNSL